jgi:hypothetical protein
MAMNNQISFTRVLVLLRKKIKENGKSYLLMFIAVFGIIVLIYGLVIVGSFHHPFPSGDRNMLFVIGLFLGGTLFSASFYSFFKSQPKTIQFLLLPATAGEKLLISFILTQIVYTIVFLISFTFIDWFMCAIYNEFVSIPKYILEQEKHIYKATSLFYSDSILLKEILIMYFITTSIAHLGSLSFINNAYVKTVIFFILFVMALIYLNNKMLTFLIPKEIIPHGKYFTDSFRIGPKQRPTGIVTLPNGWFTTIAWFLPIFLYMSCWTMSYFKIKEKQI